MTNKMETKKDFKPCMPRYWWRKRDDIRREKGWQQLNRGGQNGNTNNK